MVAASENTSVKCPTQYILAVPRAPVHIADSAPQEHAMMPVLYVMLYLDVVNTSPSWLCTTGFLTQPLFLYYIVPLCQAKAIVAHRVIRSILQVQKTETGACRRQ
jgi:hypothetical protein